METNIHGYLIYAAYTVNSLSDSCHCAVCSLKNPTHLGNRYGFQMFSRFPIPSIVSRYIARVFAGHSFQARVGSGPVARFWVQAAAINSEREHSEHSRISDPWSRFLWRWQCRIPFKSIGIVYRKMQINMQVHLQISTL